MFKELTQLGSMLKQAQGLTGQFQGLQERLSAASFEGADPEGRVRVTLSGQGQVLKCSVRPESLLDGRIDRLEQAFQLAHQDAMSQLKEFSSQEMRQMMGGLDGGLAASLMGLVSRTAAT